ncbi:MAG: oligosaccharide flippase family protein [Methylacidiphilales bacterium]|nr:oligosaccharide flippase family protein [Candidatus Methylacidiphilales bacterium]
MIFSQASAHSLVVILDYGFNFSATREIARHQDNPEKIPEIVAGVIGALSLLIVGSGLVVSSMYLTIPIFKTHPDYLIWAWLIAIAQGTAPIWYFLGNERMQIPATVDLITCTFASMSNFILIKTPDEGWKVLAAQAIAGLFAAGVMLIRMYSEISWRVPSIGSAFTALRMGWSMFFFQGSVSLYTTANTLILGMIVPASEVAFYGAAERISKTGVSFLLPITQTMFPRISNLLANDLKKAARFARLSLLFMGIGSSILALTLAMLAPIIVHILLGEKFEAVIPLLRVMLILTPLLALSNVLGVQWMLPLGLDRHFNIINISAGLINLILALFLSHRFGSMGMVWTVILSQVFAVTTMYIVLLLKDLSFLRL